MQRVTTSSPPKTERTGGLRAFLKFQPPKPKPQVIVMFCKQLSSFVRVGIPVTTAIQAFAEQAPKKSLRRTYLAVVSDLERGMRLSAAFAAHPLVFPSIVTDMVRSAEVTGNLETVLRQAAKHIEREASARRKIRSAMIYPVIVATMAVIIALGIILFVLPAFTDLYTGLGVKQPGLLVFLLGVSRYMKAHYLFILLGVLAAVLLFGMWVRTPRGRYALDGFLLKMPLLGPMVQASTTERFTRALGDMLVAGVPIGQAYPVVVATVRNRVHRTALAAVGSSMAAGQGISYPLQQTGVFKSSVIQMIRVGEETGHMDENLQECADMHEEELDYRIKRMTSFLEPALIVFVGLMVGFIAVTLITSIYSLAGGFK
jgi:type IV pilus assembly protein PilC